MSLNRLFRYVVGLIVGWLLMFFLLPLAGITRAKIIPPSAAFSNAKGWTIGTVTAKRRDTTGNPFHVGDHIYFLDYTFYAKPVWPGETVGPKTQYNGTFRVDQSTYEAAKVDDRLKIKYEKSYPWINGDGSTSGVLGRSVAEGSNVLSGWLIFVVLDFILAYIIMLILERFTGREDI